MAWYPTRSAEGAPTPEPNLDGAVSYFSEEVESSSKSDLKSAPVEPIDERTKHILSSVYGYEIGAKLGSGAYGEVFRATNRNLEEPVCALKVINTKRMSQRERETFLPRELSALIEVKHRYVVQVLDIFRHQESVFIFMEFAGNGDLCGYLHNHHALRESLAAIWFGQVCEAVHYLHNELFLAHRDIKLDNILLDGKSNTKLTDLGFAFVADKSNIDEQRSSEFCGTLPYQSPQIVKGRPYLPFKADIWSLGVTLFALINNKFPFKYDSEDTEKMLSAQNDYPGYIRSRFLKSNSQPVRHLVELMVDPDEQKRPTIVEVLTHHFLSSAQVELTEENSETVESEMGSKS